MERGSADGGRAQAGSSCSPSAPDTNKEAELSMAMVWSIQEAVERQTLQIGISACGATAVVDVLQALGITVVAELVDSHVRTRLRRNESPLPDYLHSRSEAGVCTQTCTHTHTRTYCHGCRGRVIQIWIQKQTKATKSLQKGLLINCSSAE